MLSRRIFLTIASIIATLVGIFALLFPAILLKSKGVEPLAGTIVWMRETGLLLLAIGSITIFFRNQVDSAAVKMVLLVNLIIQIGLFIIEFFAFQSGVITKLSGIVPNLILHILLAAGFLYFVYSFKSNSKQKQI